MFTSIVLLFLCVYGGSLAFKSCDDCMGYLSCEGAIFATNQRRQRTLFLHSICGYETYNGRLILKVCCSDFIDPKLEMLPKECGKRLRDSEGQGRMTSLYEFPWMALISYQNGKSLNFGCSGSIINLYYVLTAAHCVVWTKSIAGVRVGDHNIRRKDDCVWEHSYQICESHIQDIPVADRIIHSEYSIKSTPARHDIALLRLANRILFNYRNVAPICLPIVRELQDGVWGQRALVAGWGETETGRMSNVLLKVSLPVLTDQQCKDKYAWNPYTGKRQVIENKICAGEAHFDTCRGDSGSPLMVEKEIRGEMKFIQYGIVSEGPKLCGSSQPGLYTDVSKYTDWILRNIKLH